MDEYSLYYLGKCPLSVRDLESEYESENVVTEKPILEETQMFFNHSHLKKRSRLTFEEEDSQDEQTQGGFDFAHYGQAIPEIIPRHIRRRTLQLWARAMSPAQGFGGKSAPSSTRNKFDMIGVEPQTFEQFKKQLKQVEKMKRDKYSKEMGRPKGTGTVQKKETATPVPPFELTETIKKKIEDLKETTFEFKGKKYDRSRGPLYCSRQAFRAVMQKNYDLLEEVLNDRCAHNPFMPRSADIPYTIIDYAIWNDDTKALKMILLYIDNAKHRRIYDRAVISSSLQKRSTGHLSKYALGFNVRQVDLSRGGREGNNAFADDTSCYGSLPSHFDLRSYIHRAVRYNKMSLSMLNFFMTYEPTSGFIFENELFHRALAAGNAQICEVIASTLYKKKGFGFNKLHVQGLNRGQDEEFDKYRKNQVAKKTVDTYLTPAHCAAINPHSSKYLNELLDHNPLLKSMPDFFKRKVVHYAAVSENPEILDNLLTMGGVDLSEVDNKENSPLILAAMTNRPKNVERIMEDEPFSATLRNREGLNAFHVACKLGHYEVVKSMMKFDSVDLNAKTAFDRESGALLAAKRGHLKILKLMHGEEDEDSEEDSKKQKEEETSEKRVANLKMCDRYGKGCLINAVKNFHLDICKWLILSVGINPFRFDSSENSIAHYCGGYGNYDMCLLIQAAGGVLNTFNLWKTSVLEICMLKAQWYLFDYVLESEGIDVNAKNEHGKTFLYQMLEEKGNFYKDQVVHVVKDKGADVNIICGEGRGVFHLLANNPRDQDVFMAKFLMKNGCTTLDLKDNAGKTPLHWAIERSNLKMAKWLVMEGKVNIDEIDGTGESVISKALKRNSDKLFKLLAESGADLGWRLIRVTEIYGEDKSGKDEKKKKKKVVKRKVHYVHNLFHHIMNTVQLKQVKVGGEKKKKKDVNFNQNSNSFGRLSFGNSTNQNNNWGGFSDSWGNSFGNQSQRQQQRYKWILDTKFYDIYMRCLKKFGKLDVLFKQMKKPDENGKVPFSFFIEKYANYNSATNESKTGKICLDMLKDFIVRYLRDTGSHIDDYVDENGQTFLHKCIIRDSRQWIEWCLGVLHANLHLKDVSGMSGFLMSVRHISKDYEKWKTFVRPVLVNKYKGNVMEKDRLGRGILHHIFISRVAGLGDSGQSTSHWGRKGSQQQFDEPIELLSDLISSYDFSKEIDAVDNVGRSPLFYSSMEGFTLCSMTLLENGGDILRKDEDGNTCLALALQMKKVDYCLHLINRGSEVNDMMILVHGKQNGVITHKQQVREFEAKKKKDLEELKSIHEEGSEIYKAQYQRVSRQRCPFKREERSLFFHILQNGWKGLYFIVINKGVDFFQGFEDSFKLSRLDVIEKIFKKMTQKSEDKKIYSQWKKSQENVLHILSRQISSFSESQLSQIFWKILGNEGTVLGQGGRLVKDLDKLGRTPLWTAIHENNNQMIKLLVEGGCDINTKHTGVTPLIYYINSKNTRMLRIFFEHYSSKLKVNLKDDAGIPPLVHSITTEKEYGIYEEFELLQILLNFGANLLQEDNVGKSAMFYIMLYNSPKLWPIVQNNPFWQRIDPQVKVELHKKCEMEKERLLKSFYVDREEKKMTPEEGEDVLKAKVQLEENFAKIFQSMLVQRSRTIENDEKLISKHYVPSELAKLPAESTIVWDYTKADEGGKKGKVFYDFHLIKTDINYGEFGIYMFYKIQVIHNPLQDLYFLLTNYGRVGEYPGAYQVTPFKQKKQAVEEFQKIFKSKTRNNFVELYIERTQEDFVHQFGKYGVLKKSFDREVKRKILKPIEWKNYPKSVLSEKLQNLLLICFDYKLMESSLHNWGLDLFSFSLGNLSLDNLKAGFKLLTDIEELLVKYRTIKTYSHKQIDIEDKKSYIKELNRLSSEYYNLIPSRQFAESCVKKISDIGEVNQMKAMIKKLLDLESIIKKIVISLNNPLKISPIDYMYRMLRTSITPLHKESDVECRMIDNMIRKTMKSYPKKEIVNIYKVKCSADYDRFEKHKFHLEKENRMFLFHGTRVCNLLSILENGLMIRPPSPVTHITGDLFGKGLYFSDSFDKSLNYCYNYGNEGIMLVCEVALGDKMYRTFNPSSIKRYLKYLTITGEREGETKLTGIKGVGRAGPGDHLNVYHLFENLRIPHGTGYVPNPNLKMEVMKSQNQFRNVIAAAKREEHKLDLSREKKINLKVQIELDVQRSNRGKGHSGFGSGFGRHQPMRRQEKRSVEIAGQRTLAFSKSASIGRLKKEIEEQYSLTNMYGKNISQRLFCLGRELHDHEIVESMIDLLKAGVVISKVTVDRKNFARKKGRKKGDEIGEPILQYNQYIVYDERRVRIRYLIHFKFK